MKSPIYKSPIRIKTGINSIFYNMLKNGVNSHKKWLNDLKVLSGLIGWTINKTLVIN